jgi:hypothetical protein
MQTRHIFGTCDLRHLVYSFKQKTVFPWFLAQNSQLRSLWSFSLHPLLKPPPANPLLDRELIRTKYNTLIQLPARRSSLFMPRPQAAFVRISTGVPKTYSLRVSKFYPPQNNRHGIKAYRSPNSSSPHSPCQTNTSTAPHSHTPLYGSRSRVYTTTPRRYPA